MKELKSWPCFTNKDAPANITGLEIGRGKMIPTVDEFNEAILENAIGYSVALFLGRGEYAKHRCETLREAQHTGQQMTAYYKNGRHPVIYAIDHCGHFTIVPKGLLQ